MLAIIAFIVILGLLVFVHEAGHFIAAKRAGMGVEEFGFGFPPRIIGVQRSAGRWRIVRPETRDPRPENGDRSSLKSQVSSLKSTIYSLNWIPLGGFVRITGESGGESNDPKSFAAKPRWQRAVVLFAGVLMNAVFGIALFSVTYAAGLTQVIDASTPADAHIRDRSVRILGILSESPAARGGVSAGDTIIAVSGQAITDVAATQEAIRVHGTNVLTLTIRRDDIVRDFRLQPEVLPDTGRPGIGIHLAEVGVVSFPIHRAVVEGARAAGFVVREIVVNLGSVARGLFTTAPVPADIAGPIGIAVMTGEVAQLGITPLLQFAGILSVNLALLNVLPFPALDGGRLLLLLIEAIRRRALAVRIEQTIHAVGYAALLLLVVLVTYHDIVQFGGGIIGSVRSAVGF